MTDFIKFNPPVIAHRGASAYAPENTMAAFTKAAQLGARWVEFDVMQTADGMPVVFHDDELDRTTNGKGRIEQYPYAYLRGLDAGQWFDTRFSGEIIPTLSQVMEFLHANNLSANVELKACPGREEALVVSVLKVIATYPPTTRTQILFSSFDLTTMRFLHLHAPDAFLGFLLHEWQPDWEAMCESMHCATVNVNHEIMTHEAARNIKAMGKALLCYTVNDAARALELFSWGVDAVFTDAPDKIEQVLFKVI